MPNVQPNHVELIHSLRSELMRINAEHEAKIKPLRETIGVLETENKACTKCAGAGGSSFRTTAECDIEWHQCSACLGTGRKR